MPAYNVIFETTEGPITYEVDIGDQELLSDVMGDLLADLEDQGHRLVGGSGSSIEVIWNGKPLNGDVPLPQQSVQPKDTLTVRTAVRTIVPPPQPPPVQAPARVERPDSLISVKVAFVAAVFLPVWALEYLGLHSKSLMVALMAAVAACAVAFGVWYMISKKSSARWGELLPFITVVLALVAAVLVAQSKPSAQEFVRNGRAWFTLSPALLLLAFGIVRGAEQSRSACGIGGERFSGPGFLCPRCQQTSCSQHWVAARSRCTNCEEQDTPWLSLMADSWWDSRVGPTSHQGMCISCNSTPQSPNVFQVRRDMRECQKCGAVQCRWCWDLNNGRCPKCSWTMPDLPPPLQAGAGAWAQGAPRYGR